MKTRLALIVLLVAVLLAGCAPSAVQVTPTTPATVPPAPTYSASPTTLMPSALPSPTTDATLAPTRSQAQPSATLQAAPSSAFDGQRAYQDVQYQVDLGPRLPGSKPHQEAIDWMQKELTQAGWTVELQELTFRGQPVRNVVAKRGTGGPWIILGAHFDSRMRADQDKQHPTEPVPGANDGASGVAVLLELARTLPKDLNTQVWLLFIDSEDQGDLPGWDWTLGSQAFADSLKTQPDAVVIVDMIGDKDLNIYQERNSNPELTQSIWKTAAERGHGDVFINQPKYSMLDDHTPFLQKGIRAIDIIDFDYPYWHTTQDTADKVSAASLFAIGDTLLAWVTAYK